MRTCSTAPETSGRASLSGAGAVVSFRARMARAFGPVNGGTPASASYTTAASEY
jgi:hypothetical protein